MSCFDSCQDLSSHWRRAPAYHRLLLAGAGAHKERPAKHSQELWISAEIWFDSPGCILPTYSLDYTCSRCACIGVLGLPRADLTSWNVGWTSCALEAAAELFSTVGHSRLYRNRPAHKRHSPHHVELLFAPFVACRVFDLLRRFAPHAKLLSFSQTFACDLECREVSASTACHHLRRRVDAS